MASYARRQTSYYLPLPSPRGETGSTPYARTTSGLRSAYLFPPAAGVPPASPTLSHAADTALRACRATTALHLPHHCPRTHTPSPVVSRLTAAPACLLHTALTCAHARMGRGWITFTTASACFPPPPTLPTDGRCATRMHCTGAVDSWRRYAFPPPAPASPPIPKYYSRRLTQCQPV